MVEVHLEVEDNAIRLEARGMGYSLGANITKCALNGQR